MTVWCVCVCVFGHHLAHGDAIEFARRRNDHIVRKARDDDVLKLELDGLEEWLAFDEVGHEGEVDGDEDGSCVEQGVRACESKSMLPEAGPAYLTSLGRGLPGTSEELG